MTSPTADDLTPAGLAAALEQVVRATAGVTALFRPGLPLVRSIASGVRGVSGAEPHAPVVAVEQTPDGLAVEVGISVRAGAGAVATIREVHAGIAELLGRLGVVAGPILVTVVRVEEAGQAEPPD